jgi:uncharacterized membrane protein
MARVLIAGESWVSAANHHKGFDLFPSVTYHTGIEPLRGVLQSAGHTVTHLPAHEAPEAFPETRDALSDYDVVVLSDLGANSLLIHPRTWLNSKRSPNRLVLLADWVRAGGGLAMAGGYLSFQGFGGTAFYHATPVEEVLPAVISPYDDRVECPEGRVPTRVGEHPITAGLPEQWPYVLGYNRIGLPDGAVELARVGKDPLLAVRTVGAGRTLAWTTDIAPHWCPEPFVTWDGYTTIFDRAIRWLAGWDG